MGEFLSIVLGTLLWPLVLIIFGPIALILYLTRVVVINLLAKYWRLTPLRSCDQMHISSKGILMVVIGVMKLKTKINAEDFRIKFKDCFLKESDSIFYKVVTTFCGYGFTRKVKNLDLNHHIREVSSSSYTGKSFEEIVNILANDNKIIEANGPPPWEVIIVNSIQGGSGSIVMLKFDHTLGDGYSLIKMFDTLTENESPNVNQDKWKCSLLAMIRIVLKAPYECLCLFFSMNRDLVQDPLQSKNNETHEGKLIPISRGEEEDDRILISTTTLDFKKVKSIRSHTGCRVLPILTCIQVEALKSFLINLGRFDEKENEHIARYYRSIYLLPIPQHPATISKQFCNHWIPGTARVNLNDSDLIGRLQRTSNSFDLWERNDFQIIVSKLRSIFYILPIWVLKHITNLENFPHYNSLCSMPCSSKKYKLLGADLENLFCCVTHHSSSGFKGIIIFTLTRGDELDVCIRATRDLFRNQEEIDTFTKIYYGQILDRYYYLCQNA